jgi:antitoxin component of MazEF toxin-antitoxin module
MVTKIRKWGNSLAIRLPKVMASKLSLKEGSTLLIHREHKHIVLKSVSKQKNTVTKDDWKSYIVPTKKKTKDASEHTNHIVYGTSR